MEKFVLLKNELLVLIVNLQASIAASDNVCRCHISDICFVCETQKLLKRISKETGVPVTLNKIKKPAPKTSAPLTLTDVQTTF